MITLIQNGLQRHSKLVVFSLLGILMFAFVLFIGPISPESVLGGRGGATQSEYFGTDMSNPATQQYVQTTTRFTSIVSPQLLPARTLDEAIFRRLALLQESDTLGLPNPTDEQIQAFLVASPTFRTPEGGFNADLYQQFLDNVTAGGEEALLEATVRENVRLGQIMAGLGGPGYVLPFESELRRQSDAVTWSISLAIVPQPDTLPEFEFTEEELVAHYEADPAAYEVPAQVEVALVQFDARRYLVLAADVNPPTEAELEAWFETRRGNYSVPEELLPVPLTEEQLAAGEEPLPIPELTFAMVRSEVLADFNMERSAEYAMADAREFVERLYRENVEAGSPELESLIADYQARVNSDLPPLSEGNIPAGIDRALAEDALSLNTVRYFTNAAETPEGAVVAVMENLFEPRIPTFEEAREDVQASLSDERGAEYYEEVHGPDMRQALRAAMMSGLSFGDAAEGLGMSMFPQDNVSGGQLRRLLNGAVYREVSHLEPGYMTQPFAPFGPGGLWIAYVSEKVANEVPEDDEFLAEAEEAAAIERSVLSRIMLLSDVVEAEVGGDGPEEG